MKQNVVFFHNRCKFKLLVRSLEVADDTTRKSNWLAQAINCMRTNSVSTSSIQWDFSVPSGCGCLIGSYFPEYTHLSLTTEYHWTLRLVIRFGLRRKPSRIPPIQKIDVWEGVPAEAQTAANVLRGYKKLSMFDGIQSWEQTSPSLSDKWRSLSWRPFISTTESKSQWNTTFPVL